ncbi:PAS domain-containing protein [Promicromonospora sp. NPDC050262]|uniref:PAS domain-containing protein n=1 Tax=Promicromonospora sp. NPDC050262 TaxID=3155036 RepID=UPI0033CB8424
MTEPMEIESALALGPTTWWAGTATTWAKQVWWWSDETYRIHGFEPGDVVPTTALVLAHKHPQDRARVSQVLQAAALTGEPFSSVHRIMDAHGNERIIQAGASLVRCEHARPDDVDDAWFHAARPGRGSAVRRPRRPADGALVHRCARVVHVDLCWVVVATRPADRDAAPSP